MNDVALSIETLLRAHLSPSLLDVRDDSAKHAGHAGARPGGQTHFSVRIVSSAFEGLRPVARHRLVYSVLQPLLDAGLHALAIDAKAPSEVP